MEREQPKHRSGKKPAPLKGMQAMDLEFGVNILKNRPVIFDLSPSQNDAVNITPEEFDKYQRHLDEETHVAEEVLENNEIELAIWRKVIDATLRGGYVSRGKGTPKR